MQTLPLTVAAGVSQPIAIVGAFVVVVSASLESFEVSFDDSPRTKVYQGIEVRADEPFTTLWLHNTAAAALTVELAVGRGRWVDRRLVTDQPRALDPVTLGDLQERAFVAVGEVPAGAGNYANIGLRNPAGSGKVLVIERVQIALESAGAITTGWTQDPSALMAQITDNAEARNRYDRRVGVSALYQYESPSATWNPADAVFIEKTLLPTSQSLINAWRDPIVVEPGWTLFAAARVSGVRVYATYHFLEV